VTRQVPVHVGRVCRQFSRTGCHIFSTACMPNDVSVASSPAEGRLCMARVLHNSGHVRVRYVPTGRVCASCCILCPCGSIRRC
jgi:hypothetical protein